MEEVTEQSLNEAISKLHAEYHDTAHKLSDVERKEFTKKIVALKVELSSLLSKGANPCEGEKCNKAIPHGMLKRAFYEDKDGEHPPLYEVGCLTCPLRSRAASPEKAVARWNDKKYVA